VIVNGRITRINIINSGRGYKVAPSFKINGKGFDADFDITLNNLGQITNVKITNDGYGYDNNTTITVRPFTALVTADSEVQDKWALHSWNIESQSWNRISVQGYNVELYWDYKDWYATGYNQFTNIKHNIDGSYQLPTLSDSIGDVIKINNIGSGGWLLLEKIDTQDTEDYTVNYKTIGRQNGTIEFNESLYNFSKNTIGYSNRSFDNYFYDSNPAFELRIILNTIRDKLFVGDLEVEYNKLFASTLRYVLAEQPAADWVFKTSFVKAKHNRGDLGQKDLTFNNDNLQSYQDFVEEFKPYKTKLREFVSQYTVTEETNSVVTDFDLPPKYNSLTGKIEPSKAIIVDGSLQDVNFDLETPPRNNWKNNLGYQITKVDIGDTGSGYTYEPIIKFVGGNGTGATAKAYLGYGKITKIEITNPGTGYTSAPTVVIEGSQLDTGTPAKATAVLGNGSVRSTRVKVKFDRVSKTFTIESLAETETFVGTNSETRFFLEWPMDLDKKKVKIYVDDVLQLRSKYSYENIIDNSKTYTRHQGKIIFTTPPALGASIRVEYYKPLSMLTAQDRINLAYAPTAGMYGKDLAQLMTGIDYGGVEVTSFDFTSSAGWDSQPWYTDNWDSFVNTFEDEIFTADGSTVSVQLSAPLEDGVVYNLYKNGVRIDDPDYDAGTPTNVHAITNSITGDGVTDTIDLASRDILMLDGDVLAIRKITSDGSVKIDPDSYDTQLEGGDLQYSTATGLNAEDIIVDGDGFVTPTTSGGPEELVPGQILDTLDIKVYTRDSDGQGVIYSQSYRAVPGTLNYNLGVIPNNISAVIVKVDNVILADSEFTINWSSNIITIPSLIGGEELNIVAVAQGVQSILDYGKFTGDGEQTDFETNVEFVEGMSGYANINGVQQDVTVYNTNDSTRAFIRFDTPPNLNSVINFTLFGNSDVVNYSQMSSSMFVGDGVSIEYDIQSTPLYAAPTQHNILVKVGNRILNAGYNTKFEIPENNQREYALEIFQQPQGSLDVSDVSVYLNGKLIETPVQWRFDIANSSIVLPDDIGTPGDLLDIYVITDGEYRVIGSTVILDTPPADQETVEIIQMTNHDILKLERINYDVVERTTTYAGEVEYVTYNRLTLGEIKLRKPAVDAQYVWVSLNGELLTPSVDYYITDDKQKVRLTVTPQANDVIDILHFAANVSVPKFAFRQFKDMLNRTHFKRLDSAATTLAQDLNYYDLRIEVVDGSTLSTPNKDLNLPGVIFINGERIEYFVKEDNTLRQLRRGTLGTGVKEVHSAGTNVFDQNISKTVPYRDTTLAYNTIADGNTNNFEIDYDVNSINEIEVFVGGTRQRKTTIEVFDPTLALDSPEGDVTISADFSFDADTNSITLLNTPAENSRITVVKKVGRAWTTQGTTLGNTENSIARFLRAGTSELPE